jgi:hypothetical protein
MRKLPITSIACWMLVFCGCNLVVIGFHSHERGVRLWAVRAKPDRDGQMTTRAELKMIEMTQRIVFTLNSTY